MRFAGCLLLLLTIQISFAQVKPDFFPEDVTTDGIATRCYCKPGVKNKSRSKGLKITYSQIGQSTFEEEDNPLIEPLSTFKKIHQWEFDLKVPIINKEAFKLLVGYKYYSEQFNFDLIGQDFDLVFQNLNQSTLRKNTYSVILNKPLDEFKYLAFRLAYSANGNYEKWMNFNSDYGIAKFLGTYAMKPNEDLEWGFGLAFSKGFRRTSILPFLLYNRNFNDKWGIESVFPAFVNLRYNLSPKDILLFGVKYNSQSYRVGITTPLDDILDYAYNHSEVMWSVRLEHQLTEWIWTNLRFGYQSNFSSDFESKFINTPYFNVEPTNAWFFNIGLFLSPPK